MQIQLLDYGNFQINNTPYIIFEKGILEFCQPFCVITSEATNLSLKWFYPDNLSLHNLVHKIQGLASYCFFKLVKLISILYHILIPVLHSPQL